MAYEQRDNSGSMFKNNRKETEKHADMTGDIMVDGKLYWINGWRKIDKNGNPYYSFSVNPKQARQEESSQQTHSVPNDDIPF